MTNLGQIEDKIRGLIFEITNRCNLSCDYCIQKLRNNKTNTDMDMNIIVKEVDKFFKNNNPDRPLNLHFFGGEPTLRRFEILNVLEELSKKPYWDMIKPCLTTNGFIFFPEWFEFMKSKNKDFFFSVSYDGVGQKERVKNETSITVIENNIKKYADIIYSNNLRPLKSISMHLCITEDNVETLFDSFIKITHELNFPFFDFATVFPEYWKDESFSKLYKQMGKIYDYVLERRMSTDVFKWTIPHSTLPNKYDAERFNKAVYRKEYRTVGRVLGNLYLPDGTLIENKVNRGFTRKQYPYKIIPIKLYGNKNISFNDTELQLLSENSVNKEEFFRMAKLMFMGASYKEWKFNIWQIFNFNFLFINKFLKRIREIKEDYLFDSFIEFEENGVFNYLLRGYNRNEIMDIINIFDKNSLRFKIEKDNCWINGKRYRIIYKPLEGNILGLNRCGVIYIDKQKHKNKNIYETILHEIFHQYLKQIGISKIFLRNNIQQIEELLCENFVNSVNKFEL